MSRGSLARQFLVWQLVVVVLLLAAVAALAAAQSGAAFRETYGRRMLSVAEDVAATPGIRAGLVGRNVDVLAGLARSAEQLSGADRIMVVDGGGVVRSSPNPAELGTRYPDSTAFAGRAWTGTVDGAVVAEVPVIAEGGTVVGLVVAALRAPTLPAALASARGEVAALLGLALVLGVGGSVLLARRVRRQTLGLEPAEIVELVHRREAMLLGVKEGVVGIDHDGRITLLNPAARELLGLPRAQVGDAVDGLGLDPRLADVLTGRVRGEDQLVVRGGRVLVLNRNPLEAGAVVTLRDRTELAALQDRLDASRTLTDTLRAQAHEFTNRLHTIAGLTELGEHDEVRRFVSGIVAAAEGWRREVADRIGEPAAAALLVAKASLATERGVALRFAPDTDLPGPGDPALGADLVTVLGNLVDNALDAARGGWVEIGIVEREGAVHVRVRDSGPGVASALADEVFRHGYTTKAAESPGGRGLGLALVREVCRRRGGSVAVDGAEFTAVLPLVGAPA